MQKVLLIILLGLFSLPAFAQDITITGKILDNDGNPLPFATASVEGTTNGTTSELDGTYTIKAKSNSTLVFAFIGFKTQTVAVNGNTVIDVTMELASLNIDDVVVIGYGKESKISMVSSISSINSEKINMSPVSNVSQVLAGKLPGVTTAQVQGRPGQDFASITIRGGMSLGGLSNEPMLLVDGVEVQNVKEFYYLNPEDIESISVLKDASSTAVYGMRGANGVILVTTKNGRSGKPTITFDSEFQFQVPQRMPNLLNSYGTALLFNEAEINDALAGGTAIPSPKFSETALNHYRDQDMPYAYPDVDWIDVGLRDYTTAQRYSMNISGGGDKSTYYVSMGYNFQDGLLTTIPNEYYDPQFSFRMYDFRSNYTVTPVKNLEVGLKLSGRVEREQDLGIGQWNVFRSSMLKTPPYAHPVYNPDGTIGAGTLVNGRWDESVIGHINQRGLKKNYDTRLISQINLTYDMDWLLKGLSAKMMLSYKSNMGYQKSWNDGWGGYSILYDEAGNETVRKAVRADAEISYAGTSSTGRSWQSHQEYHLNYERKFGDHDVSALALYNHTSETNFSGSSMQIPNQFLGFVGRGKYMYKNKYIAEFSAGYNGSERFAPGQRFGFFPTASLGYRISEEKFFKELFPFVNQFKARYSYGLSGSDNLAGNRWLYVTDYARVGTIELGTAYQDYTLINEGRAASENVTWAVAKQSDIGFVMGLFDDRITFEFDYFKEKRENMLINRLSIPSFYAATAPPANIGIVHKQGIELNGSVNKTFNDLKVTLGGNFLYFETEVIFMDEPYNTPEHLKYEGKPLGIRTAYITEGFFNSKQEIENAPNQGVGKTLGDLRYKDFNGDGVLDKYDIVEVETPADPNLNYALDLGLNWKGFSLNAVFQGASNQSMKYEADPGWPFADGGTTGASQFHTERWTPYNRIDPSFPAMHTDHKYYSAGNGSDFFIARTDYIKFRTLALSYLFTNSKFLKTLHISACELSLTGQNLWTFSPDGPDWIDPESNGRRDYYPVMSVYSIGLNVKF